MIIGIIPARFASTRLMGKPLADIGGKPMIQHTYESSLKSKLLKEVIIATDDEKIAKVCRGFGARVIETPKDIATGSDRIAYCTRNLHYASIVVNIQGDEPFIKGRMIDEAIEPLFFDQNVNISTLAKKITTVEEFLTPSITKVVFDYNNFALYFSRSPIPFVRNAHNDLERIQMVDIYKHIGLYAYRREALLKFTSLPPTDLEQIEQLEQLRMLENDFKIKIVVTKSQSISVDTQEDLDKVRQYYYQSLQRKPAVD